MMVLLDELVGYIEYSLQGTHAYCSCGIRLHLSYVVHYNSNDLLVQYQKHDDDNVKQQQVSLNNREMRQKARRQK